MSCIDCKNYKPCSTELREHHNWCLLNGHKSLARTEGDCDYKEPIVTVVEIEKK